MGAGVSATPQVRGTLTDDVKVNADRIKFQTKDATDVVVQTVTYAVGGNSGWHTHPGPGIVQVQAGNFKIYQGSCQPTVVQKGETYIEIPGVAVRAVADGPVEWTTTLVIPGPFGGSPAPPAQTNLTTNPCA